MKKMKKWIALLLTAAMTLSLAACGNGTQEPSASTEATPAADSSEKESAPASEESAAEGEVTTLTFWSWLPTTEQSEKMIADFEAANPDIKIDYTRTEQSDFFEKLQVAMASGTGPDLFGMTTGSMMEQYAKFSVNMKETADEFWPGWENEINANAVSQCTTEDGTLAGMPLLIAGMTTIMYNKTLMDECGVDKVPTTYAELQDAAKKAKENGYVCIVAGAADDWVNSDWFVQTMQAWQNLFTEGIFEEGALGVATYPDARDQYFFARKALFFLTGSWHIGPSSPSNSEIQGTEIGNQGDVIGMAPFPSMSDSGEMLATSGVDVMVCMNKDCEKKEAAMRFIQYLSNGEGQQFWVNQLQGSPVSNNISYTGEIDGELQQQSIDEVNEYVKNAAGSRKLMNSEIEKAIQVAMQNVAAGADPAEELKTVQGIADAQ